MPSQTCGKQEPIKVQKSRQEKFMDITVVIQQMVIIFILIGVGVFLYRKRMLSEMTSGQLSGLIVNLTNPALLICSALQEGPKVPLRELGTALGVDLVIYAVLIAVGLLIPRILLVPAGYHYSYQMLTVFGNVGFIGIPLAAAVLGTECLIYVSIYNLLYNVLIYTFGISLLQRVAVKQAGEAETAAAPGLEEAQDTQNRSLAPGMPAPGRWRKLVNAGTVSAAAAIVIYLGDFRAPAVLSSTLTYIGQCTTLLSMLVLGVSVAQMKLKDIISHPKLYGFVLLRQILVPVGCIMLLRPFLDNLLLLRTTALLLAMPAGNMPLMLSKQLQIDTDTIAQGIILTTVLGLVTIPVVSLFL